MTLHGLLIFCLAYLLATASPGPGVAALVARVLSRGTEGIAAFGAGYVVGDLIWFTLAATGMAVLAQNAHAAFVIIKYAGAAYLLYLAWRTWTAPTVAIADADALPRQSSRRSFFGSLSLTLGNPKVMVFFLALLPTVVDLSRLTLADFLKIGVAICVILSGVIVGYTFAAMQARLLFRSPRSLRWLNRGTGTVMAGAAVTVATR